MTKTNLSPPLPLVPTRRLRIPPSRQRMLPSTSKAEPLRAPATAKYASHRVRERTGPAQCRRSPASAAATEPHPQLRDTASNIPQEPASPPPAKRSRPAAKPHTPPPARDSLENSCFLTSKHTSDYIGSRIGQQGNQRHQNRDIHQQREITSEGRLPRQLTDSRQSAQRFDWNRRSQRDAHRDAGYRQQLRSHNRHHVPEKNPQFAQTLGSRRNDVRQRIGLRQQIACIAIDLRKHNQSDRERTRHIPQHRQ